MKRGLLDNTTIEVKLCPVIEGLCAAGDLLNLGISVSLHFSFALFSRDSFS